MHEKLLNAVLANTCPRYFANDAETTRIYSYNLHCVQVIIVAELIATNPAAYKIMEYAFCHEGKEERELVDTFKQRYNLEG